jgi:uncharacterized lipoprotein YajG
MRSLIILASLPLLGGCVARTALDIVSAPVKVASKTVDVLTTSQSEADEKRGREMRHREERIGKLSRERDKLARQCEDSENACRDLELVEAELRAELDRPI